MAKLSHLVAVLSKESGRPLETIREIARRTREAGHIQMSGRGTSAAAMSDADAANLLLASAVPAPIKEVASRISAYRTLRSELAASPPSGHFRDEEEQELFEEVFGFPNHTTLADVLQSVVKDARTGKLERLLGRWQEPEIVFTVRGAAPVAWMILRDGSNMSRGFEFWPKQVIEGRILGSKLLRSRGDHTQMWDFTQHSILALGKALRS